MRIGIIGAGLMVSRFLNSVKHKAQGVSFPAICARRKEQLDEFNQKHPDIQPYTDLQKMLSRTDIDAVYICTPVHTHSELTIQAAENGKHILCEKPMALNVAECETMIEQCHSSGVVLQIGYMMRFHQIHKYIKQQIDSGSLGKIRFIRAERTALIDFKSSDTPKCRLWFVDKEKSGGGAFIDIGSHALDLLLYLADDKVEQGFLNLNIDEELAVDLSGSASLRLRNGILGSVFASWQIPLHDNVLHVYGEKASLAAVRTLGPYTNGKVEWIEDDKRTEIAIPYKDHYIAELEHFADCVANNREPITSGSNCIETEKTRIKLYKTFRQQKP